MCTYQTEHIELDGSGKGHTGWFAVTGASVYVDHPVHAMAQHTLNVDVHNRDLGPGARVALELDAVSARNLADAIIRALDHAPEGLLEEGTVSPQLS
ncbi:MAG: DUF6295 family protein [Acidimicrobiales bacterium]